MEIRISECLRELRTKRGNTQDELADFLSMSKQSVSKWERGEGMPDITLLPSIAAYYGVSVDSLLGVDEIAREKRVGEITRQYNALRSHEPFDKNYHLDDGIELIRNALHELPHEFFLCQLLASDLWWKGRTVGGEERQALYSEAIGLCEEIINGGAESRWLNCANEILFVIYADLNETDKALNIAYQMPCPEGTIDYALSYILKGDALDKQLRHNIHKFTDLLYESIARVTDSSRDFRFTACCDDRDEKVRVITENLHIFK